MATANPVNLTYPFNPNGSLKESVVKDEIQTVTPINGTNYGVFVPRCAPFFRRDFKLFNADTGEELKEHINYTFGVMYLSFSAQVYKGVYGAVTLIGINKPTRVRLQYPTVGWKFVMDDKKYAETVARIIDNPRVITWEQVADVPTEFPPIPHTHVSTESTDYQEFLEAQKAIQGVIITALTQYNQTLLDHINKKGDVHDFDKSAKQLDRVPNNPLGNTSQVVGGGDTNIATMQLARLIAQDVMNKQGGATYRGPANAMRAMSALNEHRSWASDYVPLGGIKDITHDLNIVDLAVTEIRTFLVCLEDDLGYSKGDLVPVSFYSVIDGKNNSTQNVVRYIDKNTISVGVPNQYVGKVFTGFAIPAKNELSYDMSKPKLLNDKTWAVLVQITM